MLASIPSATLLGASGHPVTVEVHVGHGLPGYHIVGLPDTACRESRDRVRAAVLSSELTWPSHSITVNLAPSGRRKTGAGLDLAIALGVLVASEQIPPRRSPGTGSSASSGSTARCAVSPAWPRWSPCSTTSVAVVPAGVQRRGPRRRAGGVRVAVDAGRGRCRASRRATPWPDRPRPGRGVDEPPASRPRRRARPAGGPASARDRRRRRPPPAAGRFARLGQDDAGPTLDRGPAGPRPGRRARGHDGPLGGRRGDAARRAGDGAAVPGAAPHQLGRRPRRWGLGHAAAGRDQPGPRRRSLPRRARRVRAVGARRAARAARGRRHPSRPGAAATPSAGPLPPGRGHQPMPVRRAVPRGRASATTSPGCATSAGCPVRCSIGSTSAWRCNGRLSTSCSILVAESRAAVVAARVAAARAIAIERCRPAQRRAARRAARPLRAGHARTPGRCCDRRSNASGSPAAATTGSAGSPARSPISTAAASGATPGGARRGARVDGALAAHPSAGGGRRAGGVMSPGLRRRSRRSTAASPRSPGSTS